MRALAFASLVLLAGCDPTPTPDAGLDAPTADAPAIDAGADGGTDAPDRPDGGLDAPDASDAGRTDLSAALSAVCDAAAYGRCTAPWSCGCETFEPRPTDVEACTAMRRADCESDLTRILGPVLAAGELTVDETAAAQCVALLRQAYDLCLPDPSLVPSICLDALVLSTELGRRCPLDGLPARCAGGAGVCASGACVAAADRVGATCSVACSGGLRCVGGACAAAVASGGECTDHEDCEDGLCAFGRCAPPAEASGSCAAGEPCGFGLVCTGGTCEAATADTCFVGSAGCGSGRECALSGRTVCRLPSALGERCEGDKECIATLTCSPDTGLCAELPTLGQPCVTRCADPSACMLDTLGNATCQARGRAGESCADRFAIEGHLCEPLLGCIGGLCQPLPSLGAPCSDDGLCEDGLVCGSVGTCSLPSREGEGCEGAPCEAGLFCNYDVPPARCERLRAEGELCGSAYCEPHLDCLSDGSGIALCRPAGALGAPCSSVCTDGFCGADLESGDCVSSICAFVLPPVIID